MSRAHIAPPVVIRHGRGLRLLFAIFAVIFALLAVGFVAHTLVQPYRSSGRRLTAVIVFGGFWTGWLLLCVTQCRRSWRIDGHGVERMGLLGRRLLCDDIEEIRVEKDDEMKFYGLTFVGRKGRNIAIQGSECENGEKTPLELIMRHMPEGVRECCVNVSDVDIRSNARRWIVGLVLSILGGLVLDIILRILLR
jgi:hypothetical protein